MSSTDFRTTFANQKYLNLETFRKTAETVRTPVWFAASPSDPATLFMYTIGVSGKVKRIRNNPKVRIAPCDYRGNVKGDWFDARVEILTGDAARDGMRVLNRKYFIEKRILDFFALFSRRERVVMAIHVAAS